MSTHTFELLDNNTAALILIDHQVGTLNFGVQDLDPVNILNNALWLAEAAKIFELPTVLTTSNAKGANGPLHPEIVKLFPGVPVIDRMMINAWQDKALVAAVKKTGRKQLVMAGVTADVCLTFPAISAAQDGYDVYAVVDASGAMSSLAAQASMFRMSPAGVKIANTNMVVAELQRDWSRPTAAAIGAAYAKRVPSYGNIMTQLKAASSTERKYSDSPAHIDA